MKNRPDRRRSRESWLRRLVSDPLRKLLALGLAILLWVFLDGQVNTDRTLPLKLQILDVGQEAPTTEDLMLSVLVPSGMFTVTGFRNGITGEPITHVAVKFRGPKHLIGRLRETPPFTVLLPSAELNAATDSIAFDLRAVRSQLPELQPMLDEMTPHSIKIMLERNSEQEVPLSLDLIQVLGPAGDPEFESRIQRDSARFSPATIALRGPQSALQRIKGANKSKLFRVDLRDQASATGVEVNAPLQLLETWHPVRTESTPTVRLFLKPHFVEFKLDVPVVVDPGGLPPNVSDARIEQLEVPRTTQVVLQATGALEAKLSLMSVEQRQQWALEKARLLINLAAEQEIGDSGSTATPHFYLYETEYQEGRDYQAAPFPVVLRYKR